MRGGRLVRVVCGAEMPSWEWRGDGERMMRSKVFILAVGRFLLGKPRPVNQRHSAVREALGPGVRGRTEEDGFPTPSSCSAAPRRTSSASPELGREEACSREAASMSALSELPKKVHAPEAPWPVPSQYFRVCRKCGWTDEDGRRRTSPRSTFCAVAPGPQSGGHRADETQTPQGTGARSRSHTRSSRVLARAPRRVPAVQCTARYLPYEVGEIPAVLIHYIHQSSVPTSLTAPSPMRYPCKHRPGKSGTDCV